VSRAAETDDLLDAVAKVLLRAAVLGILLLLLWAGIFMMPGDLVYRLHGPLVGLTEHDLNVIHYCGLAFLKLCVLQFFLFPYIAIRLVLRGRSAKVPRAEQHK
jgi:hypothetical protein